MTTSKQDAELIETNQFNSEIRHSDGKNVWPGYADNMTLKKGYWQGTDEQHTHCDTLEEAQYRNRI